MTARRVVLPLALLVAVSAAPAHATLLVRSDGAGLLIQDKNGIKDNADMFSTTLNGQPAYRIRNLNDLDVFKFDRRTGYVIRFEAPAEGDAALYRAESRVLARPGGRRYVKQFARAVALKLTAASG